MKRKTKSKSHHMSIRVPTDLATAVLAVAAKTGWSDSKAMTWLASLGQRLLEDSGTTSTQARTEFEAWSSKHVIEAKADRMKREAAAAVRSIVAGKPPRRQPAARKAATTTPAT